MTIALKQQQHMPDMSPRRLENANINPVTRLATDYLNHFNEVIMLVDMLEVMPECVDEVLEWQPKTYQRHFQDSCFAEKDLAIAAYEQAPPAIRLAFDRTIADIDMEIGLLQETLRNAPELTTAVAARLSARMCERLQPLMVHASGIVNGTAVEGADLPTTRTQDTVDALFT